MRSEKSVSLNLEDAQGRARAAAARSSWRAKTRGARPSGQQPLKAATEIKEADAPDAILAEAAQIAADLSSLEPRFLARARRRGGSRQLTSLATAGLATAHRVAPILWCCT